jgi:putative membrane protein
MPVSHTDARFEAQPNVGNHFAWIRTLLALQRTLMAAIRTAVSLIGFGFTVAQFFERVRGSITVGASRLGPDAPRNLGLTLIAAGVLSLAVFTWQYRAAVLYLRSDFPEIAVTRASPMRTSVYLIAFIVMLIGVAAFGSVLLHF